MTPLNANSYQQTELLSTILKLDGDAIEFKGVTVYASATAYLPQEAVNRILGVEVPRTASGRTRRGFWVSGQPHPAYVCWRVDLWGGG